MNVFSKSRFCRLTVCAAVMVGMAAYGFAAVQAPPVSHGPNQRVANGPTFPPDPWDGKVANGPTFPPDPWDGKVANGPTFPPDPWDGKVANGPTFPPDPWDGKV
jgi:hypothetical protein